VTELLARPLLSQYFPDLAEVAQPLSGEYAGRDGCSNACRSWPVTASTWPC
jgi:hypothetical protein